MKKYLRQYLDKYAELEISLSRQINKVYRYIINIPCYDEPDFDLLQFDKAQFSQSLLIIIINENFNSSTEVKFNNQKLLFRLSRLKLKHIDIFIINKTQENQLPLKQGVGLARKIAADLSLKLYAENKVLTPWLYCLDADVTVPNNYLNAIENFLPVKIESKNTISGFVYNFKHVSKSKNLLTAARLYENKLNSYVNGLKYAGSHYAFHTIGSTMVINLDYYAKVRGFPKRLAGEDFYLLNKLAKLGNIISLDKPILKLSSRESNRTAFGTGLAIKKIILEQYCCETYPEKSFELLRIWLLGLAQTAEYKFSSWEGFKEELNDYADLINLEDCLNKLSQQNLSVYQRKLYLTHWFDGFKTMKFINYFSDLLSCGTQFVSFEKTKNNNPKIKKTGRAVRPI